MPDAVVIGSGPNGLVAANMLADRGWSVEVFEAQDEPGGAVRSGELIEPGFVNDSFSAFYPLAAASPTIQALGLERFGLRWCRAPLVLAHPAADGTCPILSTDLDETAASFDALAPGDGDAWRQLFRSYERMEDGLLGGMLTPFPPIRAGLRLATSLRPAELLRFARFAVLPVRRMGEEHFASDAVRRVFGGTALHADLAPEATPSGFMGWLLIALGQRFGWPVPEGGSGRLTAALVERLEAAGGRVTCGTAVTQVHIRAGRAAGVRLHDGTDVDATRAVIADVLAPTLYRDLVGAEHLPASLLKDLGAFQLDDATVKVDWTLDGPVPWSAEPARRAGTVHLADSMDELTLAAAHLAMGLVPERPLVVVGQQSMTDPSRQPARKETAWAYHHVPQEVRGDAGGDEITGRWDKSEAETIADRIEARIEAQAPGFRSRIRGRHVFTPPDLAEANANLRGGAINGGTARIYQQLVFRPVPGRGRAETPVRNLYLGSSSAHPGGGVHGACGA
ncbi:MAG TPA: NAD(P)/FAD-dependent oxidoreductase, partial [Methylomirabilota bacterium]